MLANPLSKKLLVTMAYVRISYRSCYTSGVRVKLEIEAGGILLATWGVKPPLLEQIQEAQKSDKELVREVRKFKNGEASEFKVRDGILEFRGRVCVPRDFELRRMILEVHSLVYAAYLGAPSYIERSKRSIDNQG